VTTTCWTRVAGVECRLYPCVEGGPLVVRVAPVGTPREIYRACLRVARTIAHEYGLGRIDPEAVAHSIAFSEDKLRLHFYPWSGFGSGVLAAPVS
jgi:hypothetical protein